jgi:Cu+-exporting ATPase
MSTHIHDQPATTPATTTRAELTVGGMTCASCAARIEKKLNRLHGVTATVNFATETATIEYHPASVSTDDLVATVEATGYTAKLPQRPEPQGEAAAGEHDHGGDTTDSPRQRVLVSAALTIPVVATAMVPALQFRFRQWISLTLAAPVVM